jgi:hypothetical protein
MDVEQPATGKQPAAANSVSQQGENSNANMIASNGQIPNSGNKTLTGLQALPLPKPNPEANEPIYYCGAETKKGTPCSRRVKGNVRCYQHVGMPAMAAADKLRIN